MECGALRNHLGASPHSQPASAKSTLHFPFPKIELHSQRSKLLTCLEPCMRISRPFTCTHSAPLTPTLFLELPWLPSQTVDFLNLGPSCFSCMAEPKAIHLSLTFGINFLDSCLPVHLAIGWPDAQHMLKAKGKI